MSLRLTASYHCDLCGGPNHYQQGRLVDSGIEFELMQGFDEVLLEALLEDEGWLVEDGREYCETCRGTIEARHRADAADDYEYEMAANR